MQGDLSCCALLRFTAQAPVPEMGGGGVEKNLG